MQAINNRPPMKYFYLTRRHGSRPHRATQCTVFHEREGASLSQLKGSHIIPHPVSSKSLFHFSPPVDHIRPPIHELPTPGSSAARPRRGGGATVVNWRRGFRIRRTRRWRSRGANQGPSLLADPSWTLRPNGGGGSMGRGSRKIEPFL